MEPPNPDEVGVLAKFIAAAATLIGTGFGMFKMAHRRIADVESRKADKEQVDRHHGAILDLYQKHEKVGDRLTSMEDRNHARHVELLNAIHAAQMQRGNDATTLK